MTDIRKIKILDANGNPLEAVSAAIPILKTALYDRNGNPIDAVSAALAILKTALYDKNGYSIEAVSNTIPQLKTTLYDAAGNAITSTQPGTSKRRLDVHSLDQVHSKIHEGVYYMGGHYNSAVAAAANLDVLIITGANYELNFVPNIVVGGDAEFRLYEGTTVSANGTSLTMFNSKRSSSNTTESSHYHTPTVTGVGTQLGPTHFIPGGSGPFGVGGSGGGPVRDGTEIDLKVSTNYLLRVTNITGGAIPVNIEYGYYEA